jgi:hypothetical protein
MVMIDLNKSELYAFFKDNIPLMTLYSIFVAIGSFLIDYNSENQDPTVYTAIFVLMILASIAVIFIIIDGFNVVFSYDELSIFQVIDRTLIFISASLLAFPVFFIVNHIMSNFPMESYWGIFLILFWAIPLFFVGSNRVIAKWINSKFKAIISIFIELIIALILIIYTINVRFTIVANYLLIGEIILGLVWISGFNILRYSHLHQ